MSRLRPLLLLALAVALAIPAGASARSSLYSTFDLTPAGQPVNLSENYGFVGPVLAGDSILYARGTEAGVAIARTDDGVTGRSIGNIRDLRSADYHSVALDASEQRVALAEVAQNCDSDCRTSRLVADRVLVGPLDGPPVPVGGCGPDAPGCGAASCFEYTPDISVSGTAIAYLDRCAGERIVIRDDGGAGPPVERTVAPARPAGAPRIAGRYVAWTESAPESVTAGHIVVYDWVAGQEAYRFEAPGGYGADVQEDGKVAYAVHEGGGTSRVWWASAGGAHPGPLFRGSNLDVQMERDRIALRARDTGTERRATLAVLDLEWRELARHREIASLGGWDFDGTRLAWATHPCERAAIVAWDIDADARPPALPAGRCPVPAVTVRSTGVRGRSFGLPMRCPAKPALGCRGSIRLVARSRSGRRYALGTTPYDIMPGWSSRVKIVLSKAGRAFVAKHRGVTVTATAVGVSRSGVDVAEDFLTRTSTFRLSSLSR